jgi:hypothetical protein
MKTSIEQKKADMQLSDNKKLSSAEVSELFESLLKTPALTERLSNYELQEVGIFANKIIENSSNFVLKIFQDHPNIIEIKTKEATSKGWLENEVFEYILQEDSRVNDARNILKLLSDTRIEKERLALRARINDKTSVKAKPVFSAKERAIIASIYMGLLYHAKKISIEFSNLTGKKMQNLIESNIGKNIYGIELASAKEVSQVVLRQNFKGASKTRQGEKKSNLIGWLYYDGYTWKYLDAGWTDMLKDYPDLYIVALRAFDKQFPNKN